MKSIFYRGFAFVFSLMLIALVCFSCSKSGPKGTGTDRNTNTKRVITIINNTGNDIKSYQVRVSGTGAEIAKGDFTKNSFELEIPKSFDNDPNIEVGLVDVYGKGYAKSFSVPFKQNTDTAITKDDRISEGVLKDKWKDLVEWFNKHK